MNELIYKIHRYIWKLANKLSHFLHRNYIKYPKWRILYILFRKSLKISRFLSISLAKAFFKTSKFKNSKINSRIV